MTSKLPCLALAGGLLLATGACTDTTTAPETAAPVPEFNFSNGPLMPGPNIVRSQNTYAMAYVDPDAGLLAVIGTDIVAFCTSGAPFDIVDLQTISVPEDANRLNRLIQGDDMTASVWPFTSFDCGLFTTMDPVGTGMVKLVQTDNDVLTFLNPDSRNANAFGFRVHGALTDPSGHKVQFNSHSNCVWDGDDLATLKCQDKIGVH